VDLGNKVLIVDDDEKIRIGLHRHILKQGYDVTGASTIGEANAIIKLKEIDIAIVDLDFMDGLTYGGTRIIENINKIHPAAKIIIFSGYKLSSEIEEELKHLQYNSYLYKGARGNPIEQVIDELERYKNLKIQKKCFVIMPFSETKTCTEKEWTEVFELIIKPAVKESGYDYRCERNSHKVGNIIKNIIVNLNSADIVIADLTDRNANVFYELGVRHTLNFPTILITQNIQDVPFDLQGYKCIQYDQTPSGVVEFKKSIKNTIKEIETAKRKINYSPVGDFLQLNT
jgi:ActR/RegA family two-component response regulator